MLGVGEHYDQEKADFDRLMARGREVYGDAWDQGMVSVM